MIISWKRESSNLKKKENASKPKGKQFFCQIMFILDFWACNSFDALGRYSIQTTLSREIPSKVALLRQKKVFIIQGHNVIRFSATLLIFLRSVRLLSAKHTFNAVRSDEEKIQIKKCEFNSKSVHCVSMYSIVTV